MFPSFAELSNTLLHIYHIFFKPSLTDRHLGPFPTTLTIVNNAVMNVRASTHFQVSVFVIFGYMPRRGIVGLSSSSVFHFWEISIPYSVVFVPVCTPTNSAPGSSFLHILTNNFLDNRRTNRCEVISHFFKFCTLTWVRQTPGVGVQIQIVAERAAPYLERVLPQPQRETPEH